MGSWNCAHCLDALAKFAGGSEVRKCPFVRQRGATGDTDTRRRFPWVEDVPVSAGVWWSFPDGAPPRTLRWRHGRF